MKRRETRCHQGVCPSHCRAYWAASAAMAPRNRNCMGLLLGCVGSGAMGGATDTSEMTSRAAAGFNL